MSVKRKRTILLVDDDTSLLITLGDFLRFEGYEVVTAGSAEEGLRKLEHFTPDLIILDMSMPGIGGAGFLKRIGGGDRPKYPVLVLTARAQLAEAFGDINVDGFIAKPCDPRDLLAEVNRILFAARGRTATPSGSPLDTSKVLLGESEDAVRKELAAGLTARGFAVTEARNGAELLEKAVQDPPRAVVMNVVLGSMNGEAVAGMLREMPKTRGLPVILYQSGIVPIPDSRYANGAGNIKKFVNSNRPEDIAAALRAVAAVPETGH